MLSFMAMDFFRSSPLLVYPLIALAIFIVVFCAVSLDAMRKRAGSYARIANLPLQQDPSAREQES